MGAPFTNLWRRSRWDCLHNLLVESFFMDVPLLHHLAGCLLERAVRKEVFYLYARHYCFAPLDLADVELGPRGVPVSMMGHSLVTPHLSGKHLRVPVGL